MSTPVEKAQDALQQALDNCAKEPIHIPGAIQPHGYLLVVDENFKILKCSANFLDFSGLPQDELIGTPLNTFIKTESINELANLLIDSALSALRYCTLTIQTTQLELRCDAVLHRSGAYRIVELEPHRPGDGHLQNRDFHQELMQFSVQLQKVKTETDLFNYVVAEIKQLINFGRVKLYRFDNDWNGEVVAEARDERMKSYLGLNFPASDIPEQARKLYSINYLRLIPDTEFTPVRILPDDLDQEGAPLDLSFSCLRSVSNVHLQYLINMNLKASMSISVMQNGRLWGMIVCHHDSTYRPSYAVRMAAELMAHTFSAFLSNHTLLKFNSDEQLRELKFRELNQALSPDVLLEDLLEDHHQLILDLLNADGVIIKLEDKFISFGMTPDKPAAQSLIDWAGRNINDKVFASNSLSDFTGLQEFENNPISGAIVTPITRSMDNCIIFFRREITTEKKWAGKPEKSISQTESGYQLTPRASFQRWVEVVSNKSRLWSTEEVELSAAISGMLLSKQYEDSLRLASYKLDAVVNNSTSLIYIINTEGLIVQINAKAREAFCLPKDGLVGNHYREVFSKSLSDITDEHIQVVQTTAESTSFNEQFVQGGSEFHVITVIFPLYDSSSKVYAYCIISSDVSEMHNVQETLKTSNKELERVAFVASHDLQEPIRMIALFTRLLRSEYADHLDETAHEYINYTLNATDRMRVLIHDLLEYARLEKEDIDPPIIESNDVLEQTLDELKFTSMPADVSVTIASALPSVPMKPEHFTCIMQNLISNAFKYQKKNTAAAIVIDCTDDDPYWRFSVSDNGIGIKPEYLTKIFDIFQRLHSKKDYDGTGIGLAICTKITELYGGKVWAESTQDKGSTFFFTIRKTRKQPSSVTLSDRIESIS